MADTQPTNDSPESAPPRFSAGRIALVLLVLALVWGGLRYLGITMPQMRQKEIRVVGERADFRGVMYSYPEPKSEAVWATGQSAVGTDHIHITYDPAEHSGTVISFPIHDLREIRENGKLSFLAKGVRGGEIFEAGLESKQQGLPDLRVMRPVVLASADPAQWTKVEIPLLELSDEGFYWNAEKRIIERDTFQWDRVRGFVITTAPGKNQQFDISIDEVKIEW